MSCAALAATLCAALPPQGDALEVVPLGDLAVATTPSADASSGGVRASVPHLATAPNGDAVLLTWIETHGEHDATLFLSRVATDSDAWEPARTVAAGSNWFVNWADRPGVAALDNGTLAAHWLERLGDETYAYGVRFVLSHDAGDTWTAPRWLHDDDAPVEHGFCSFVSLDDSFGAVWLDGRAMFVPGGVPGASHGATQLLYRTIATDGTLGPEAPLDARCCDCCPTSAVATSSGDVLAVYRDRSEQEVRDISFVGARGDAPWSAPRTVADDGWTTPGCPVNGPRSAIERGDGGRIAVAWYTGAGGGAGRVQVAYRDADGTFGRARTVDDGAPVGRVALAFAGGELYVAWLEVDEGVATWRVRILPADGPPTESVLLAEVPNSRASGHLVLASDRAGVVAAWTDPDAGRVRTARLVRSE